MRIRHNALICAMMVILLSVLSSCSPYESPESGTYCCEDPYMELNPDFYNEVSKMEYNGEIVEVLFSAAHGSFTINEFIGKKYDPETNKEVNVPNGNLLLEGEVRSDNGNGILYLYPDTDKYTEFSEEYVLKKKNNDIDTLKAIQ